MTHCDGYRAAAVARLTEVAAIGVDAEPQLPLPAGVVSVIALPFERKGLTRLMAARPEVAWERVIFSAKESVYKAWVPLTGRSLSFDQCAITLHLATDRFTAQLFVDGPVVDGARIQRFEGRWRLVTRRVAQVRCGLIVTAVAVVRGATVAGHEP
jgi:4'-phosphopantetheinyl transferase EntD